ncbi:hypothetical protein SAMN05660337_2514 [Maridesulfovibrio ferrireducens]|uniref:CVNH domain-containing protein n=1 Tax=Maridesulfovibrio ferrireducens TaxID=246191 RepID=A0A1G9IAT8_9BACT|nr:hypothetical protein [Maridesulfovibrio ferrireducens]SDL22378.1 hypothetical protein SAMN05660337_2514 [Maridesulfovibrio ferrireducens]
MQSRLICRVLMLSLSIMIITAACAFAETITYKCKGGAACIEERIDFGAATVTCADVNGDVLAHWVCEYELEYTCRNTLTGQVQKGGFNPISSSLCSHLCGPCKDGWE